MRKGRIRQPNCFQCQYRYRLSGVIIIK